jgi:polysaccharide export outer membrane protein
MAINVREFLGRSAKPALLFTLWVLCAFSTFGQVKVETPVQTNDKIQQLAALNSSSPQGIPVGIDDLIHIDVFDVPELSRDVRVSDAGDISLPLVPGRIPVAGLSVFQLQERLAQLLIDNGLVSHPQVSVFLKERNSQPVSVIGAVNHPMVYQVVRPTSLLEILAAAGGITDDAGSQITISRPAQRGVAEIQPASETSNRTAGQQVISIRLQDLLESGDSKFNVSVYGGDVVSVPRAGIVYVLGAGITQPGGYVVQSHGDQITVLKAVALARGLTGYAKADSAVIMRTNPLTGQKVEIPIHIQKIEKQHAEDVVMMSNDVLYIPDSAGRKALSKGAQAALGIGSGIAIYRGQY